MKKMLLPIIFIIILALLVLAGCVSFSTNIPGLDETSEEPASQEIYQPVTHYVPVTDEEGEQLTDNEGSQIFIPVTEEPATYSPDHPGSNEEPYTQEYYEPDTQGNVPDTQGYVPGTQGNVPATQGNVPTTQGNVPATQGNVPTTQNKPQSGQSTTSAREETPTTGKSERPTQSREPAANEFDIFRSGTFYIKGSMKDETGITPLEMAITPTSIYMLTKFETIDLAILVSGGQTYLMYPDQKVYLEMSSTVMGIMGLDPDDMISSEDLGFSDLDDLSKADRTYKATLKGKDCTVYEYNKSSGTLAKVYMNGNKLLGIESLNASGVVDSATYVDSITGKVPADKTAPGADYKKSGVFEFIGLLTEVME